MSANKTVTIDMYIYCQIKFFADYRGTKKKKDQNKKKKNKKLH